VTKEISDSTSFWSGKVALVTGAGSGIGRASAETFARAGAKVVVADLNADAGGSVVAGIRDSGGLASFIRCDVADEDSVARMVANTLQIYGRLDAAHNNAGISPDTGSVTQTRRDVWDRIIAVNLTGVWLCMKYEIDAMLKSGGGAIVNTGSVSSLKAGAEIAAYTASKHGLVGLTKVAALECAQRGIRVNMICPGITLTPMLRKKAAEGYYDLEKATELVPIRRFADPQEMADSAVWLCSAQASYLTGVALPVDGGMLL
jgi:NAD(P)-dependent dehydrogenase (short-subunit alcohol dehydrogenase family)